MSELQKAWAKRKLDPMHPLPEPLNDLDEEPEHDQVPELPDHPDDGDSSSASSASSASSTGTVIPSPSQNLFARPQGVSRGRTLEQIPWTTYFERELFLKQPGDGEAEAEATVTYHAYLNSPVDKGPLFVMHHGAGSSGLVAALSAEIRKRLPNAGILSPDARGHGSTSVTDGTGLDLKLDILTADLFNTGRLGAALLGYGVLDVVEGSAMDALQSMLTYLSTRPGGFVSLQSGIDWHIRSRTIRNSVSARTSVPALLVFDRADPTRPWRWRTDLAATQPFWEGWLDTELTIGQMQGKYALQVFPEAGHFIHEDLPEKTALAVVDFYRRNDRSALVLPPKVGDLLKQGKRV
uniref:Protein phosphatase methylesterase 1 n=1 Tax=Colletotrichum fructicola (strain Nara gc5) TaxID=1213859 RepID=L2G5T7_COLFN